jgi:hypothetical protein
MAIKIDIRCDSVFGTEHGRLDEETEILRQLMCKISGKLICLFYTLRSLVDRAPVALSGKGPH